MPAQADVLIEGERILEVGKISPAPGDTVIDCTDRLVFPGFIDAHSHVDGAVFREDVQLALLRQGITTAVAGQDGVSYAPGDGSYASHYFAAINGAHPHYGGGGVAELLASYDRRIPLGIAYLVPAGTVRHQVMGAATRAASDDEVARMVALVAEGIADGAVGLSTGLDYVPGIFADAGEIAALCAPVAAAGLPYVTHMRGGYEENAHAGVTEVARIAQHAGVPAHVSHFHTRADEAWRLMAWLEERGVEATFDAYPYTRGCSLLSMALLPPEYSLLALADSAAPDGAAPDGAAPQGAELFRLLSSPQERQRLREEWFPRVALSPSLGPAWPELITIGHTSAPEFQWAHGMSLAEIAERRGTDAVDAALDLLLASRLEVNAIMAVQHQRPVSDLGRLISHPRHVGGSDGIFIGAHPHPRARGTFASYLGTYARDHGFLDWAAVASHLSTRPAEIFHLGARGRIAPGFIADIAIVDPERVREGADYAAPLRDADGIDDVLVAGQHVLAAGALTGALPGGGVRAAQR